VHLFDIDIPGKITFKESETLTQGESFTVVDTPACRMGVGICYDLRFPELAMVYAQRGVQLIVYPGKCATILRDAITAQKVVNRLNSARDTVFA